MFFVWKWAKNTKTYNFQNCPPYFWTCFLPVLSSLLGIFLALQTAGADLYLMNFIKAIYKHVRVFINDGSNYHFAFFARSGVLQGCPLSASLFVISINPFLENFRKVLYNNSFGVLYACADDLGSALLKLSALHYIYPIFFKMAKISGLILQPHKCVIIPLVPQDSNIFPCYSILIKKFLFLIKL